MPGLFIVKPLFSVAVVLFAINFCQSEKKVGYQPFPFSHHKKKELQNYPAMLSEIKMLIEKSFSLLQVNEGLI